MNKLKYDLEISKFLCGVLKSLDAYKIDSFEDRFRNQKIQYLLQIFNLSPHFDFNLYIKGPYSPELTNTIFEIKNNYDKECIEINKFVSPELQKNYNFLKFFISNKNNRDLELVTTVHWLKSNSRLNKSELISKLKEIKNATDDEISKVFEYLKELEL